MVSDFGRIAEWDPGVAASRSMSPGPPAAGARFHLALKFGWFRPEMTYRIVTHDPPCKVVLRGDGDSFAATDIIEFSPMEGGTRVSYTAHLFFHRIPEEFQPALAGMMTAMGRKAAAGMKQWLDRSYGTLPNAPAPSMTDRLADRAVLPGLLGFTQWGFHLSRLLPSDPSRSMAGKTVVITGATSGIGRAAALELARLGARLVFVARDPDRAAAVQRFLAGASGNPLVEYEIADLSRMSDVNALADTLCRKHRAIDVLINNAGALFSRPETTAEGLEKTFATDLLSPFLLTERLIPALEKSGHPRIISVSSGGMYTQAIDPENLENRDAPFDGPTAYARAKRGLVLLTRHWARRLAGKGVAVHAMHPGWVETPGVIRSLPRFYRWTKPLLRTPAQGADTVVWLASADTPGQCTGGFWLDRRLHDVHVFPGTRQADRYETDLVYRLRRVAALDIT